MANVVFTEQANADLANIFDFLAQRNPAHARKVVIRLCDELIILETMPLIGRPTGNGKRQLLLGKRPTIYAATYRYVTDLDTVYVLDVRSQRGS